MDQRGVSLLFVR